MPPQPILKYGVIAADGTPAEDVAPKKWTTRTCDLHDCKNFENLNKCARCKTAMYCSKECQKADWVRHKAYCKMVKDSRRQLTKAGASRHSSAISVCGPPFQRLPCLRHHRRPETQQTSRKHRQLWFSRHAPPASSPRSRLAFPADFCCGDAMAEMMTGYMASLEAQAHAVDLLKLHKQHRDELKARTRGMEDYATVIVVAKNLGEHALPGGLFTETRFKPIGVHKQMVRSAQLTDPTLDWYTNLKIQVDRDIPNQAIVG
ncbi:hypothetical protein B0H13DRAFT_2021511 [Mycena leptocephala]|nr:hypothetical protein B0H13DRAFT_2021511 [Mycena leptocephala]